MIQRDFPCQVYLGLHVAMWMCNSSKDKVVGADLFPIMDISPGVCLKKHEIERT